ncbi:sigma-70 family RNA polymerase sigma factor [bacterium]|nr:sigma-70 family RNA polymerase sigma factor [bacterium]
MKLIATSLASWCASRSFLSVPGVNNCAIVITNLVRRCLFWKLTDGRRRSRKIQVASAEADGPGALKTMAVTTTSSVRPFVSYRLTGATDAELIRWFTTTRDELAFAEIVTRHGPLVFGTCRRMLRDRHRAEDAFQAVFLVLARKAATITEPDALGAWLHGVACRISLGSLRDSRLRSRREHSGIELSDCPAPPEHDPEVGAILDDELRKLPGKYRVVLVACDLERRPRRLVAESLGIPEGTLSSRLTTARKMLAARLTRRGVVPAVAGGVAVNGPTASAGDVPRSLLAAAIRFGSGAPDAVPGAVSMLANGVAVTMPIRALVLASLVLFAALAALGPAAESSPNDQPSPRVPPADGLKAPAPAPVPKVGTQPAAGPNKLLFSRSRRLVLIDPDGKNEQKVATAEPLNPFPNNARLSPDGKQLALLLTFVGRRPVTKLYVRGLDEQAPVTDLEVECQMIAWSPDGTEIVCGDVKEGENHAADTKHAIVSVRTKATIPLDFIPKDQVITDWSRDGKYFLTTLMKPADVPPVAELHLWSRDGKEHRLLTDTKSEAAAFGQFSPDGSRVLFGRFPLTGDASDLTPNNMRMRVLDLATGKTAPVTDLPKAGEILGFCWSPDGKRVAYIWREVHDDMKEDIRNKETFSHLVVCDSDGKNAKTIASEKGPTPRAETIGEVTWR